MYTEDYIQKRTFNINFFLYNYEDFDLDKEENENKLIIKKRIDEIINCINLNCTEFTIKMVQNHPTNYSSINSIILIQKGLHDKFINKYTKDSICRLYIKISIFERITNSIFKKSFLNWYTIFKEFFNIIENRVELLSIVYKKIGIKYDSSILIPQKGLWWNAFFNSKHKFFDIMINNYTYRYNSKKYDKLCFLCKSTSNIFKEFIIEFRCITNS